MLDFGCYVDCLLILICEDVNVFFSFSGVINVLLIKLFGIKLGDYWFLVIFFLLMLFLDFKVISYIIL